MSSSQKRNLAASVRQRLLSLSRQRAEPFDLILVRYGIERLLYRLSQSPYTDRFLLKGAVVAQLIADTDDQENLVPYRWHAALYPVLTPLDDEINI